MYFIEDDTVAYIKGKLEESKRNDFTTYVSVLNVILDGINEVEAVDKMDDYQETIDTMADVYNDVKTKLRPVVLSGYFTGAVAAIACSYDIDPYEVENDFQDALEE